MCHCTQIILIHILSVITRSNIEEKYFFIFKYVLLHTNNSDSYILTVITRTEKAVNITFEIRY